MVSVKLRGNKKNDRPVDQDARGFTGHCGDQSAPAGHGADVGAHFSTEQACNWIKNESITWARKWSINKNARAQLIVHLFPMGIRVTKTKLLKAKCL